ncbi:hypothetical protein OUZ56_017491 [Daphnia magna]|uniref:Uncharacterized protein n=1 Tax=Daphnia magna TaxID=35525 RepID=A0ABR0ASZ0_9CRUS|nr:hypothetical protein OUZ56_017491 [Daphnia magna]
MSELPLKTRDDLVAYEKLLETNADQNLKLVRMVKQIGGETLADAVKRAWERVLSLEVRAVEFAMREFAQVTDNALMKETRNAVKDAAETVRNKTGIVPQEPGRPKVIGVEENQLVHLSKLTVPQNNQPRKVQVPGLAQVAFNASFRVLRFHIQEEYDDQRPCRIELRNNVDTEETEGLEEVVEFFIKEEATFIEK